VIIYITQCAENIIIHNIIKICTLFDLYIINVQKILQTRMHNRGQRPIDGAYLSLDLGVSACGYLWFGKGPPQVITAWSDIITVYLWGHD
jgi:hypothetical protein